MRAGLSTIQQTLTPEAASVLTHSIAEAARRNHGQTTPLHVAATLLAAPSGLLRQACIRSHPHSSHPLQCRALELCFSVALDRIPSTTPSAASAAAEPPISNALMAALKRAQAHQRRGCPEQQQQPLLAVKVELEQLLISILDDPSVSRVMREASFSSTAVKAAIEQSLTSSSTTSSAASASHSPAPSSPAPTFPSTASLGLNLGIRAASTASRNLYMNPRLHQNHPNGSAAPLVSSAGGDQPRTEEVKRVMDILLRSKKRNPVLVGDSDPAAVMREVLKKIEDGTSPTPLQTAKIISVGKDLAAAAASGDRSHIPAKIKELGSTIGSNISDERGVVLDLGDLKWLVESPGGASAGTGLMQPQAIVSEAGRAAVTEMTKLLKMFEGTGRLWLIGTATCTTYLRCQVYHQSMESDWDLEAVPIAPRSTQPNMIQRLGANGILSSSVVTLSPMKNFTGFGTSSMPQRPLWSADASPKMSLCASCMETYEHELATLVAKEFEKSSSNTETNQALLPQWLQLAKLSNAGGIKSSTDQHKSKEQEQLWKQSTEELQKKWRDTCSRLHSNFHPVPLTLDRPLAPTLMKPLSLSTTRPALQSKLTLSQGYSTVETESNRDKISLSVPSAQSTNPPGSPVKTDLVLGNTRLSNPYSEKTHGERTKDSTGCTRDEFSGSQRAKVAGFPDIDSFKRLYKGLAKKVEWQQEAASVVASVVLQCKSGNGKRRTGVVKSDTWLLFIGPDKIGKRKMATVLSEMVSGTSPTTVNFGSLPSTDGQNESKKSSRGRTCMDRIVEAVRQNPFSVILLEDVDQADALVQSNIRRAMERGRLPDSYGREVSLGSVIFVLTASFVPEELKSIPDSVIQCEERILHSASIGWKLELCASAKPAKRPADWLLNNEQPTKVRKSSCGISLDLNLAIGGDDEGAEGSWNSSDVTAEHENDKGRLAVKCSTSSFASELMEFVDSAITFKPVDFAPLRRTVLESLSTKFTTVMGSGWAIKVEENALERIVGGLWIGGSSIDEWTERVLTPSLRQLKANLKTDINVVIVTLASVKGDLELRSSTSKDCLPATMAIAVNCA